MLPITVPSLLTCNQSHDYADYYRRGYRVFWYQHWNRGNRGPLDTGGDYDFTACRQAQMDPGVWGVLYEDENVNRAELARQAAARALSLGAEHLMFDIEYNGFDAGPIIDACKYAGWSGPVHLTCLGAPEYAPNGSFYDYGYDLQSFLDTGGGIFPQAYYSPYPVSGRHPNYAAAITYDYFYGQCHVPEDRLNMMIWPNGYNSAEVERDKLAEAGLGKAMSVFLAETTNEHNYDVLEAITLGPDNETGPEPDVCAEMAVTTSNVQIEMGKMTAKDPEAWIKSNPGEADEILRLCVYAAFSKPRTPKELKSSAGRAASGIAQNGVKSLQL